MNIIIGFVIPRCVLGVLGHGAVHRGAQPAVSKALIIGGAGIGGFIHVRIRSKPSKDNGESTG